MIKKNWQKNAAPTAVNTLLRVAGAGVGAFILKKLSSDESTNLKKTLKNVSGPAVLIIGTLGDMTLEDEKLRAVCQGLSTIGALKSIAVIAPAVAPTLGLSGLSDDDVYEITNGIDTPEIMNGAASNEQTTAALPTEIAEITNADSNGRVFSEVADYIEQGADNAIEVNGIEDEEEYPEITNGVEYEYEDEDEENVGSISL